MSGIAGIIHFDGRPVEPGLIEGMTAAMAHRGPDGIHHWCRGGVALGQCMLRTTPESLEEQQPLANEDESLVLVMDGRVDNWEELRRELLATGAVLRTRADAELVLRAYETWGRDCLRHIDGDFAFVIWDENRREAFCARDRVGNKPLNYHWDGRTLSFASELHAILALPWVPQELNEGMVAEFLANEWLSREETFWQGVRRLTAASGMVVTRERLGCCSYWQPRLDMRLPCSTEREYAEHYRLLLLDVIRRMSRSLGPLACEVSGGLDSSAIFALAEQLRCGGNLRAPALHGYTLDFGGDADADELEYVSAVALHAGAAIERVEPTFMPIGWYVDRVRRLRNFPSYPNGVMGVGIRETARARGSAALLVGVGGDEWLSGSRAYYAEALAGRQWKTLSDVWRADCSEFGIRRSLSVAARQVLSSRIPDRLRRPLGRIRDTLLGPQSHFSGWLGQDLRKRLNERRSRLAIDLPRTPRAGQRPALLSLYDAFNVTGRELEEGLAADAGIELRRPFYAPSLIEMLLATPECYKLRGSTNKRLHRAALAGCLPESVLGRATKADFMVTFRRSLNELRDSGARLSGDAQPWVPSRQVLRANAMVGNAAYWGVPEWRLWTLFGCVVLANAAGDGR